MEIKEGEEEEEKYTRKKRKRIIRYQRYGKAKIITFFPYLMQWWHDSSFFVYGLK